MHPVLIGGLVVAGRHLEGIQALRGAAALAVVAHHALEHSNGAAGRFSPDWLTTVGAAGVDLFFVISGFIMMWTSFPPGRAPISPGSFLFRRISRIYPLYWLACAGMLMLSAAGFLKSHSYGPEMVARSLLLLPGSGVIGVAWTLVFEMWFYLLFAALLIRRASPVTMGIGLPVLLVLAALGARSLPAGVIRDVLQSPLPLEFCFGVWLALVAPRMLRRPLPAPACMAVGVLAIAGIVGATLAVPHPDTSGLPAWPRALVWGLPALLLVAAMLPIRPTGWAGRALVRVGDASYALYLSHVFVMIAYGRAIRIPAIGALPQQALVPLVILASVVLGFAFHYGAERPIIAQLRRIGGDRRRAERIIAASA